MNRAVYVPAFRRPLPPTSGSVNHQTDGERLQRDLQKAIDRLNAERYEVVTIVPIESGLGAYISSGGGAGYSYTEGLIIVVRTAA
jgi:hypothetical protein